jgi:hypothetical protein
MKQPIACVLLIGAALLCHPPDASAQYVIRHGTFAAGGGVRTGSNFVWDTAGQSAAGAAITDGSYRIESGFWYVAGLSSAVEVAITAFHVEYDGEAVLVSWDVAADAPFEGFNVYRAEGDTREFERLNESPLDPAGARTWRDATAMPGRTYEYRLGALDHGGETYSLEMRIELPAMPLTLFQNVPNPFNPSTRISFFLPEDADVRIEIFDVSGRRIAVPFNGRQEAGRHSIHWNGTNAAGGDVASGVYYCRMSAGKTAITKKLVLMR